MFHINEKYIGISAGLFTVFVSIFFFYDRFYGKPPSFSGVISLSGFENKDFFNFVELHNREVVSLDAVLDASVSTPGEVRLISYCYFSSHDEAEGGFDKDNTLGSLEFDPIKSILDGKISGQNINLPLFIGRFADKDEHLYGEYSEKFANGDDEYIQKIVDCYSKSIVFQMKDNTPIMGSSGGTGLIRFPINGDYRITTHIMGNNTVYKFTQLSL